MVQSGEFINKPKQAWRDFRRFPAKDFTQPLADLVANRTAMNVVEHHSYSAAARHNASHWFGLDLIWLKSEKSKFASSNLGTGEELVKSQAAGRAVALETKPSIDRLMRQRALPSRPGGLPVYSNVPRRIREATEK